MSVNAKRKVVFASSVRSLIGNLTSNLRCNYYWQIKKAPFNKILVGSIFNRREVLASIGGSVAVSVVGCWRGAASVDQIDPACVVKPQQTEGPYFVEEKLERSDTCGYFSQ